MESPQELKNLASVTCREISERLAKPEPLSARDWKGIFEALANLLKVIGPMVLPLLVADDKTDNK